MLLTAAAVLFCTEKAGRKRSIAGNAETVEFMEKVIPARKAGIKEDLSNPEMPSVRFEGCDYDALFEYGRFSVKLPVSSSWDRKNVNYVPCRFTGSVYDGTLIIGGVDAEGQFDFISQTDIGDTVTVTDMKGNVFTYGVEKVIHAKNAKASKLRDDNFDLTFFAKDKKSGSWLLVRCSMK